jgi:hypothetical protein
LFLVACASDGGPDEELDVSDRDPRCVSACTAPEPRYQGVGGVCDAGSRTRCLDECETRIANLATVCQSCLTEEACFSPRGCSGDDGPSYACNNGTCTLMSEFGMCTFTYGDMAGELRCRQQTDPRRDVSCIATFRPTTQCASVCS